MKQHPLGSLETAGMTPLEQLKVLADTLESLIEPGDHSRFGEMVISAGIYTNVFTERPDEMPPLLEKDMADVMTDIEEALNEYACLPYSTFYEDREGDYGFFPLSDHELENTDGCVTLNELPSFIRVVNERGNVTLYEISAKEVWSYV